MPPRSTRSATRFADQTTISIEDLTIEVTRKRMRYMRISVNLRTSRVRISAPRRVSMREITEFATSRIDWIRKHLANARPEPPGLDALGELGASAARQRAANNRREIQIALRPIVAKWESVIGVRASDVRVRRMTSRWGTCNPRTGAIRISSELAEHPPECLEYVVVHELVHLLEPSHNKRFYALMERFLPGWRSVRARLNGRDPD